MAQQVCNGRVWGRGGMKGVRGTSGYASSKWVCTVDAWAWRTYERHS